MQGIKFLSAETALLETMERNVKTVASVLDVISLITEFVEMESAGDREIAILTRTIRELERLKKDTEFIYINSLHQYEKREKEAQESGKI